VTPIKILICGSRGWKDPTPINAIIAGYDVLAEGAGEKLIIVHGHAPKGADAIADRLGRQWGAEVIREPADWDQYGKAAGFIRNQRMLDNHKLDLNAVYAFRAYGKSNGTDDMVDRSEKAGIPTFVISGGTHPLKAH
jgi:hypothetical protein